MNQLSKKETELLKDPKASRVISELERRKEHADKRSILNKFFEETKDLLSRLFGKLPTKQDQDDALESLIANLHSTQKQLEEIDNSIKHLQEITPDNSDEEIKYLREVLLRQLKRIEAKEMIVNVPDPKIIDKTKTIKETKVQKEMALSLGSIIKILSSIKQESGETFISNRKPSEAIPVILTDKMRKEFYNAIQSIVASTTSGSSNSGGGGIVTETYDYIDITHTDGLLTQAIYKDGGASGTTVATVDITYDGDGLIDTVTKT